MFQIRNIRGKSSQIIGQSDSHVQIQVPDLHHRSVNGCKYGGGVWGPPDGGHGPLGGFEAHHRVRAVLLPQLDGPIRGAAEEHIRTERRPLNMVHRALRERHKI